MELRLPLEVFPGRQATCRAVFGTWGSFPDDARASHCPFVLTSFTGWSSKRCPGIGFGVRRSPSEGAGGLGAAGAAVQSVLCGAPCPPRTGQNTGLRVGALAGGSGLRTPSLLCRQGSSVWARPGAVMPTGEQRSAGPRHLPVVPGEETRSPPCPPRHGCPSGTLAFR